MPIIPHICAINSWLQLPAGSHPKHLPDFTQHSPALLCRISPTLSRTYAAMLAQYSVPPPPNHPHPYPHVQQEIHVRATSTAHGAALSACAVASSRRSAIRVLCHLPRASPSLSLRPAAAPPPHTTSGNTGPSSPPHCSERCHQLPLVPHTCARPHTRREPHPASCGATLPAAGGTRAPPTPFTP